MQIQYREQLNPNAVLRNVHIIGNGKGFSKLYPVNTKGNTVQSLDSFVKSHSIVDRLLTEEDPAMCESKAWRQTIASYQTHQQWTKPHSPW
jgi:hypothetical protein